MFWPWTLGFTVGSTTTGLSPLTCLPEFFYAVPQHLSINPLEMEFLVSNMNFEQWADKVTDGMIRETFKAVKEQNRDASFSQHALSLFLAKYVGNLLFKVLNDPLPKGLTNEEQYERKHQQYVEIKTRVLEAVAAGFSSAMRSYSGKNLDFYCKIEDVTRSANKEPC